MASSDSAPLGLRRNDPDETEGRLVYRQRANAEARMQMALTRKAKMAPQVEGESSRDEQNNSSPPPRLGVVRL